MFLKVVRLESSDEGIRGILLVDGVIFATTLERPWVKNTVNISCIPEGNYKGRKYSSHRHGKTLKIVDVINRTGILFHIGNSMSDSAGCLLLGDNFAKSSCKIESSTSAVHRFKERLVNETQFTVTVTNAY
jgi:hypothetical protein